MLDAIYCALIGLLTGVVYYSIIKDYYKADYFELATTKVDETINKFFMVN